MHQEIHAIRFDVQDIGKHVKSSKKRFSWTFGLNGRNHTIILDFSFISGKVKLVVDRKTMLESQLPANSSFQHPFTLDGYALNILQQGQSFELRINNKVFSHLYNQAKTNTEFKNYEDEVKDIKVNQSSFQNANKTIKLNIGALDGGKKKTKQAVQTQNWGNFGGSDLGIPSYFGESKPSATAQGEKKTVQKNQSLLDEDEQSSTQSNKSQQKKQQPKSNIVDFFAQSQSQAPSVSISPSQQQLNLIHQQKDQFNTMQNMFSTMQVSPQVSQPKQDSLYLLNSATMEPKAGGNDFNTMQMMFATNSQNASTIKAPTNPNPTMNLGTMPTPQDFNTMQNLFATGVPQQNISGITLTSSSTPAVGTPTSNINDFYTINNLFATGQVQPQLNLGATTGATHAGTAGNNFNTMQNLFATNAQVPSNVTLSQQPQTQSIGDIQNVNLNDFNTMQNLFKTGSGVVLPPPSQPTTTAAKQEDPFSLLGLPQMNQSTTTAASSPSPMMFNTYSGSKTSSSPALDASSFGTMQKNSSVGIVDFFQNSGPAQQAPMPNFSKKKQAAEDLI